ncbi:toxin TcdB middle/C-terminal domain-containing protein, partial [Trabulsiella odontotermitis]|uniref:toxin TcdB middle/C-terminal domain-containing protein n=1 Tax=Trabulsiella odontotermitis TaxID=379893 RepID=UPI000AEA89E3
SSDEAGYSLRQGSISYPRRDPPASSPYPDTLPETLFASSFDDQQKALYLDVQHNSWHEWRDLSAGHWLYGISNNTRHDCFSRPATVVPAEGLTLDDIEQHYALLFDPSSATFTGQQQSWYQDGQQQPTITSPAFPPRVAFTETAVLNENILSALEGDITESDLAQAGYSTSAYLFPQDWDEGTTVWTARHGHTAYAPADHFFLPTRWRSALLTGEMVAVRDHFDCVVVQITDAAGLTTSAEYDWRFLTPHLIIDANANRRTVTLDALGRVTSFRFRGTEDGVMTGYSDQSYTLPETADEAINVSAPIPVSRSQVYVADSWMLTGNARLPPHTVTLTTDRYDSDPDQQIRQQVVFSDGFGRPLQTAIRQASGSALQRNDDGSLGAEAETDYRWAVSGKTEYDNKGQPVRQWQPYFLNSWKFVSNDAARTGLYADTLYYDPTGREWLTETAKGGLRRTRYTPWFIVNEDENDTSGDNVTH